MNMWVQLVTVIICNLFIYFGIMNQISIYSSQNKHVIRMIDEQVKQFFQSYIRNLIIACN